MLYDYKTTGREVLSGGNSLRKTNCKQVAVAIVFVATLLYSEFGSPCTANKILSAIHRIKNWARYILN